MKSLGCRRETSEGVLTLGVFDASRLTRALDREDLPYEQEIRANNGRNWVLEADDAQAYDVSPATPLACRPRGSALTFREGSPSSSAGLSCKYLGWDNGGLGTRATRCEPYTSGFMLQWLWDKTPEKPTNPSPPARNVWEADDQRTVEARHADRGGPQRSTRMRVMAALAVAKSPYGRTRRREAASCCWAHSYRGRRRGESDGGPPREVRQVPPPDTPKRIRKRSRVAAKVRKGSMPAQPSR